MNEGDLKFLLASRQHWYNMYIECLDAYQKQVHKIEELEREVHRLGRRIDSGSQTDPLGSNEEQ